MKFGFRFLMPLVGLAAMSAAAPAAHADNHSVSGHVRTRFELNDNANGTDTPYTHMIINRARLNLDVTPAKPLMVRITPEFTHTFGEAATAATFGAAGVADANFTAHEAWMSWMANDMLTVYAGRQVLTYGNGLIIGVNDWGQMGNNHDALRLVINHGYGRSDLIWAKRAGRAGTWRNDNNLYMLYNAFTPSGLAFLKNLDFYLAWNDDQGFPAAATSAFLVGARFAGDAGMLNYDLEGAAEFGKVAGAKSQKGFMVDATVGAAVSKANVAFNVAYANSEWTEVAPNTHELMGKADVLTTRNNIMNFGLAVDGKFNDTWGAGAAAAYYLAPKDDAGATGGVAQVANKRQVGFGADLAINYMPEKMLTFDLGYDMFKGMSAIKPRDKFVSKFYLQGTMTF